MDSERRFCTVFVGGLWFGIQNEGVREVLRQQAVTRVPLAPPEIAGLINMRGQIVTVIDLRLCLKMAPRSVDQAAMNLVLSSDGGAVGLLVDDVGEVVQAAEDRYETMPESLPAEARELVPGVYKLPDGLLHVLAIEAVVAPP
jgi:purine-binding chemotaxis protein CheW